MRKSISIVLVAISTIVLFTASLAMAVTTGTLAISSNGTQTIKVPINPNNTISSLYTSIGNLNIPVGDVAEIVWEGEHAGKKEVSLARAAFRTVAVTVPNMPNNDKGKWYIKTSENIYYPLREDLYTVTTSALMYYRITPEVTEYGYFEKTQMVATVVDGKINIKVTFGCNMPMGIRGVESTVNLVEIDFTDATSGLSYGGTVEKDANGNLYANISGITPSVASDGSLTVTGKITAMEGGTSHALEFNQAVSENHFFFWKIVGPYEESGVAYKYNTTGDDVTITYKQP